MESNEYRNDPAVRRPLRIAADHVLEPAAEGQQDRAGILLAGRRACQFGVAVEKDTRPQIERFKQAQACQYLNIVAEILRAGLERTDDDAFARWQGHCINPQL